MDLLSLYYANTDKDEVRITVKKSMCKKIEIIHPGDVIIINVKAPKRPGDLVLVFDNETSCIDRFNPRRALHRRNAFPITRVIMNNK